MKRPEILCLGHGLILTALLACAGCDTTSDPVTPSATGVTKERGVYTTLATSGQNLDMAGSAYVSCEVFQPGQTPAAVVLGSGAADRDLNNYNEAYKLKLVEGASGAVMEDLSGQVDAGKADIFKLPIRKSGRYRLILSIGGSVYDTWDFTVNRDVPADTSAPGNQPPAYAKGDFSVSIEPQPATDAFIQYDDTLMVALTDAIQRELPRANQDDFAQIPAGHVAFEFDLSATGQVTAHRIMENTLTEALGQFFLHALQNGAPYKSWPAEARAAIGADTRHMKVVFYYD